MVRFQKELILEEQGVLSVAGEVSAEGRRAWLWVLTGSASCSLCDLGAALPCLSLPEGRVGVIKVPQRKAWGRSYEMTAFKCLASWGHHYV